MRNQILFFLAALMIAVSCTNEAEVTDSKTANLDADKERASDLPAHEMLPIRKESIFSDDVVVGADQLDEYIHLLRFKNVGVVVNPTSTVHNTHLVDTLLSLGVNITKIFALEHGWKGTADAGEKISNSKDKKTGLDVVSLHGKNKRKPQPWDMDKIDVMVYDIQDVGARFYTYISSLHYVMEACAENDKPLLVLDRPNPNGHFVDGPILEDKFKSFVGLHPVPVVHGMTVGEYAQMINGENWLADGRKCELKVVKCRNYDHNTFYDLPVKPSPNLPNIKSIYLYPSLCLFEGTVASVGRGTDKQFQVVGHPKYPIGDFRFKPSPKEGAKSPKFNGKECRGFDYSILPMQRFQYRPQLDLSFILAFYKYYPDKDKFFLDNNYIDKLAGTDKLRHQIQKGMTRQQIGATWQAGLNQFKNTRKKYLLYSDFE